ncbi:MAG TPA: HEAT repeat domain-containing protein, partial [Gemmatimonadales bacterium]|nr:HEAT repeat domain-containing protein [Gemmatimonadales bacterium]
YRLGGTGDLQAAVRVLREQASRHPNARTREDAEALAVRIQGELARRGDARAAEEVAATASAAVAPAPPTLPARPTPAAPRPPRTAGRTRDRCDDENDTRLAAINALLQMDADRAMPILKKVLARRDEGSVCLRRRAVFLVAQHETPETEQILLGAARQDPDLEVREQAVFWLSEVESERAVAALDSILRTSDEPVLQEKAIFALSQMDLPRAREAVRAYAAREDAPTRVREQAIFWLHENDSPENAQFLRTLFGRLGEPELKEKVLFSLAEMGGEDNLQWLVSVALDERQPVEIRKKALFWAGEGGASIAQLVSLYDRSTDREMKEQLIFVFSQRDERAAADKLVQIARTERDPELRKKALFWLSESDDPRAAEVLTEILEQ